MVLKTFVVTLLQHYHKGEWINLADFLPFFERKEGL